MLPFFFDVAFHPTSVPVNFDDWQEKCRLKPNGGLLWAATLYLANAPSPGRQHARTFGRVKELELVAFEVVIHSRCVIGGLIAFGVIGLFIGPVLLAVTHTLLIS